MYKIAFIDDEALVKMGIMAIIDWKTFGFDIVGDAKDGAEGLHLIEKYKPDLVITDIVMPEMDGLEMIQKAKNGGSQAIFVVLSSYDEFDLVKRAMKLGARDYILKMRINKEVIGDVVRDVLKELDLRGNAKEMSGYGKTNWELETLRNSFFTNLLSEIYLDYSTIRDKVKELEIQLNEKNLRIAYIITDIYAREGNRENCNKKMSALAMRDILKDICNEFFVCYCIQWEDGKYLVILSDDRLDGDSRNVKVMSEEIMEMSEAMIEMLKQYGNINASVGISESVSGYMNLHFAYKQAKSVLNNLFAEGYGKIFFYSHRNSQDKEAMDIDFLEGFNLQFICESAEGEQFRVLYETILKLMRNNNISNENASCQCSKFLCFVEEKLSSQWMDYAGRKPLDDYMYRIYHCETVNEMRLVFHEYCQSVYEFMMECRRDDTYVLVRDAKKYINEHIYASITLKEVAEYLHISAGYLSGIFSKYEKLGFANYVNDRKIQEAKHMFRQENLKIYEASFRLGYENSSYFSKIFKKYAGYTPKEYLEQK